MELYALAVTNVDCVAVDSALMSTLELIESPMNNIFDSETFSFGIAEDEGICCGGDVCGGGDDVAVGSGGIGLG